MKYDTSMRFGFQFRIRGGASSYAPGTCQVASGRPHMCASAPIETETPWHLVAPCGTLWHPVAPCGTYVVPTVI